MHDFSLYSEFLINNNAYPKVSQCQIHTGASAPAVMRSDQQIDNYISNHAIKSNLDAHIQISIRSTVSARLPPEVAASICQFADGAPTILSSIQTPEKNVHLLPQELNLSWRSSCYLSIGVDCPRTFVESIKDTSKCGANKFISGLVRSNFTNIIK